MLICGFIPTMRICTFMQFMFPQSCFITKFHVDKILKFEGPLFNERFHNKTLKNISYSVASCLFI
jgi:hypothetical protein